MNDAPHRAHKAAWESLPGAALDALPDSEMHRVAAHVDACEDCRVELEALRRVAAQLIYAAPLEPVDADRRECLRAKLEARARSDSDVQDMTAVEPLRTSAHHANDGTSN